MPKQETLAEQHLELLQSKDIPCNLLPLWHYVQFRLEVKTDGYQTAYFLIIKYPELLQQLTALECFELGSLVLNDESEELTLANRIHCLTQACLFFYYAYKKNQDDKQMYLLLLQVLRDKDAWELGQKPTYAYQEISSVEEEVKLLSSFTNQAISRKPFYSQNLERILQYLETHSNELNPSEHQIIYKLGRQLSYNIPLTDSLNQPHIKQQISHSPLLANNAFFKPLLSDEACKDILKEANRGQRIYETLPNYALTKTNLKILAEAKEDVVDYLKQSVDESTDQVIDDILDNNSNESVYKSYFYVQRGFFKPKLGCGALKKLQNIQQKSLDEQAVQTKKGCLFSLVPLFDLANSL